MDAALAAALDEPADPRSPVLSVFVHLAKSPTTGEADLLRRLGVQPRAGGRVVTATLSAEQVGALSRDGLVRQIRLSQRLQLPPHLRPLG